MTDHTTDAELGALLDALAATEPWGWPTETDEAELNALLTDLANADQGPWDWPTREADEAALYALLDEMARETPTLEQLLDGLDAD